MGRGLQSTSPASREQADVAGLAALVSLPRADDGATLPRILPLIEQRMRSTGGPLRIDVLTGGESTSYACHHHILRPLPSASPLAKYDFAFIVHETADGDVEWSRLTQCIRKARRVLFIHHSADYVAFPCSLRTILRRKLVLAARRRIRPVELRLIGRLAAAGEPIAAEKIEAKERKLRWLTALSAEEIRARFGESFQRYFGGKDAPISAKPISFRGQAVHAAMAETLVGTFRGKQILDLGCGYGIHSLMLREDDNRVIGLDRIEHRARLISRYGYLNLRGVSGVGEHLPFPEGSFDLVFAHDSIQHVCDIAATFAECRRILRPGGAFVVSEVHPYNPDLYAAYGPSAPMRLACRQLYIDQRADYIRRHADVSEGEALRAARRTESFTTTDLDALIAARLSSQVEQSLRRVQAARGELTATRSIRGWCEERYLRPTQIIQRLARAGFSSRKMRTACLVHDGGPTARIVRAGCFLDVLFPRYMVVAGK